MNNAMAELMAAMTGLILIAAIFTWFALLPAIGILWLLGWL